MRPPISVADVLRAYAVLRPKSAAAKQGIAEVLGFERGTVRAATRSKEKAVSIESEPLHRRGMQPDAERTPQAPRPAAAGARNLGFHIKGPVAFESPTFPGSSNVDLLTRKSAARPAPFPSLLVPTWTRAILSTALTQRRAIGSLDVTAAVERIARAEAIWSVPRLKIAVMASSVHVLLDVGTGMLPFAEDQRDLIESLRLVAGKSAVQTLNYVGAPDRAGVGSRSRWLPFDPPPGAAILVLGEMGISGVLSERPSLGAWEKLANTARRRGSRLVAFVPYPSERWPRDIALHLQLVHWDRSTQVGRVKPVRVSR